MLLGCIGDDFTGSSDLANTLAKQGMRTVQYSGVPAGESGRHVEAGVVALKSRSIAPGEAVRLSLEALAWLQRQGCRQFFFKYCSTFDSTPEGNIGPVADALADALKARCVIVCPAFPGTGRAVYQGHLFVHGALLSESGMQDHPLTPMTDPDLRRWLGYQSRSAVGHVPITAVLSGVDAVKLSLAGEERKGRRLIVVDALRDEDLITVGRASADLPLITGGSGIALGLPENFRQRGQLGTAALPWRGEAGRCIALSGSCSETTRAQVRAHASANPTLEVVPADVMTGATTPAGACEWLIDQPGVPLAYSSADPEAVAEVQETFGRGAASQALEGFFANLSSRLVAAGARGLIVAGGETSGAVVEALDIGHMDIGPEIDPGVPAMRAGDELVIALKSGNFGGVDFFARAADVLAGGTT